MPLKKLSMMAIATSIVVVSLLHVINAQNKPNPFSTSTLPMRFDIEAGKKTAIELYNISGDKLFTIFDNIFSKDQAITFYEQPYFWEHKCENCSELALPFPILESGIYFIKCISPDTVYTRKFVFMK